MQWRHLLIKRPRMVNRPPVTMRQNLPLMWMKYEKDGGQFSPFLREILMKRGVR